MRTCPKCGHDSFTEWAEQVTSQKGVKLADDGTPLYEDAQSAEIEECDEILWYDCDECGTDPATYERQDLEEQEKREALRAAGEQWIKDHPDWNAALKELSK